MSRERRAGSGFQWPSGHLHSALLPPQIQHIQLPLPTALPGLDDLTIGPSPRPETLKTPLLCHPCSQSSRSKEAARTEMLCKLSCSRIITYVLLWLLLKSFQRLLWNVYRSFLFFLHPPLPAYSSLPSLQCILHSVVGPPLSKHLFPSHSAAQDSLKAPVMGWILSSQKRYAEVPQYLRIRLYLEIGLHTGNQVKRRSLGWALMQYDWCP